MQTKRNRAKNKIRNTLRKRFKILKKNVRNQYLKAICSNSGVCLAFSKEREKIKEHFDHFQTFKYIEKKGKRIGNVSNNGFVYEIPYEHAGYKAHAILKSSSRPKADSMVYEHYIGTCLNTLIDHFPCIVETYGLYRYNTIDAWQQNKEKGFSIKDYAENLTFEKISYKSTKDLLLTINDSCQSPLQYSVLIQHFHNVKTVHDFIEASTSDPNHEQLKILFHVYFLLHILRKIFTHYDLHANNVLVYCPNPNKLIEYIYVMDDGQEIRFTSPYIVKIIDYGRCYMMHFIHGQKLKQALCYLPNCNRDQNNPCGSGLGYQWIDDATPDFSYMNVASNYPNPSHDLRFYALVKAISTEDTIYQLRPCKYTKQYGTEPIFENNTDPNYVCNVSDAFFEVKNHLEKALLENKDTSPTNQDKIIASMRIYGRKQMKVTYHE